MVFPLLYAVAIWALVMMLRRRLAGFAILIGSVLPIAALTTIIAFISRGQVDLMPGFLTRNLAGYGIVLHLVSGGYAFLILLIGLVLVVQPRRTPAGICARCGYDLTGSAPGRCPECGKEAAISLDADPPPAARSAA